MAKKANKKSKTVEVPVLVVQSKIKEYLSEQHDMRCAGDVAESLTADVVSVLDKAAARAAAAKRGTVKGVDI